MMEKLEIQVDVRRWALWLAVWGAAPLMILGAHELARKYIDQMVRLSVKVRP